MLRWLRPRRDHQDAVDILYGRIVAAARQEPLYRELCVPDTMDGRLEMILLQVVLVLERLKAEGPDGQRLGQRLMERLVADLDDAMRQIGLGDDSVAHRVPRLAGALSERARDYTVGDGGGAEALAAALIQHVYRATAESAEAKSLGASARRLAQYVVACRAALAGVPVRRLVAAEGVLAWPPGIDGKRAMATFEQEETRP